MFRKQVDPKIAGVVTLITLAAIQWVYWRNLVYTPPGKMAPRGGGGGGGAGLPTILGSSSLHVENWVGDDPGYRDGAAWEARFAGPNALAFNREGSLIVADSRNHCIRAVTPTGRVSTLTGGAPGDALGPATAASFRYPSGVAVATDGTIVIADTGNNRLCRLSKGTVSLLAGGGAGLADGPGASARFRDPGPLTFDKNGRLWVIDAGNRKLRMVTLAGLVSTPKQPPPEVEATLGLVVKSPTQLVWGSLDGISEPTPSTKRTGRCGSAALLSRGARAFGDLTQHVLYFQPAGEQPILLAGRLSDAGIVIGDAAETGARASFATPAAVASSPDGTLYIADYDNNQIRRIRLNGTPYQ